ncbi:efflux RND transporter periplasmic adaptor subunit [Wenzhouxiangella marina]|uniref:RND family efflux transporter MFP subunit n=1 Tax=Wenzhouxiangella marina TaxID=1579979 RepID=A0A0K0XWK7_9GAMM|nr:efflux RND transporter periplasmic adaptor subunit [Wenzhouxiangella marina]AKS42055.1 RND family efflux transporter MFP subunit [Wenzhouxiangella marina]MBB6086176.1 RND family efflux transporter MFP subunit [Wenzhouxiangella marina]
MRHLSLCLLALSLTVACGRSADPSSAETFRWVRVAPVSVIERDSAGLSGTVRARFETPVAFQVGGRIAERRVDAGQRVEAGEVMFELDPRDLEQAVRVAQADLDTAEAELATAAAETRRNRDLLAREFISNQAFEQVELAERASRERVDAARARLEQASNALDYASLRAGQAGVLIEVSGEPGQVVAAGQELAVLAGDGPPEIEVFLPEALGVPASGRIVRPELLAGDLELREVAGAADPLTRTWTARYRVLDPDLELRLGSVVRVALDLAEGGPRLLQVPIGAINERGQGAQVWQIVEGRAHAVPVELLDLDQEHARIMAELPEGAEVIALGTHLLHEGMAVRALDRP